MKILTAAEARLLLRKWEDGASQRKLAEEFGIPRSRVQWWIKRHAPRDPAEILKGYAVDRALQRQAKSITRLRGLLKISAQVIQEMQPSSRKRQVLGTAIGARFGLARSTANEIVGVSRRAGRHSTADADIAIVNDMARYFSENPGQGFKKVFRAIFAGQVATRKALRRIYLEQKFMIKDRPTGGSKKVRPPMRIRKPMTTQSHLNAMWSMDFMMDATADGKRFWVLNIIDDFNREALVTEVASRRSTKMVVNCLARLQAEGRTPEALRSDNGTEFKGLEYIAWTKKARVRRVYIKPRTPTENVFVERFNRTMRNEIFDRYSLESLSEAGRMLEDWRVRYNLSRPHLSLGGLSPLQFSALAKSMPQE